MSLPLVPPREECIDTAVRSAAHNRDRWAPRPKVLIIQDFYLPGENVGGPVWTMANLVEHLGDRFEFLVAALDRDFGSNVPYPNVQRNTWNRVGRARVFYLPGFSMRTIARLIRQSSPEILYLNSFFGRPTMKALLLRRLGVVPEIPVIVAPHGEFSAGALQLKAARKNVFVAIARRIGLYRDAIFHASTRWEERDIRKTLGTNLHVHIASDLPSLTLPEDRVIQEKLPKTAGQLRAVFLSRIAPKKNLRFAIEMLAGVPGDVYLDIYGPIEDRSCWLECVQAIRKLPDASRVQYCGPIPHQKVFETLSRYHFFLLPTLGENFGYAIIEAMLAGCPVLISDTTPWRGLAEKRAGWDIPLNDRDSWQDAMRRAVAMDQATYSSYSSAAHEFAVTWSRSPKRELESLELFRRALESDRLRAKQAIEPKLANGGRDKGKL